MFSINIHAENHLFRLAEYVGTVLLKTRVLAWTLDGTLCHFREHVSQCTAGSQYPKGQNEAAPTVEKTSQVDGN